MAGLESGMRFGKWTVLCRNLERESEDKKRRNTKRVPQMYTCRCDCGTIKDVSRNSLQKGESKSCGCLTSGDLTGKMFGNLEVLSISPNHKPGNGIHKTWLCLCNICGKTATIRGSDLRSGYKTDCGCLNPYRIGLGQLNDLTGRVFGHLTVIKRDISRGMKSGKHAKWICRCDLCGNETSVSSDALTRYGKDRCTECINISIGEAKISELLCSHNIEFDHNVSFKDCIFPATNGRLRFDFVVHTDPEYLIEYDGVQHFKTIPYWEGKINLDGRVERDNFKTQWCKDNDIKLIRIPYTHLKDLCFRDINPEQSDFLVA